MQLYLAKSFKTINRRYLKKFIGTVSQVNLNWLNIILVFKGLLFWKFARQCSDAILTSKYWIVLEKSCWYYCWNWTKKVPISLESDNAKKVMFDLASQFSAIIKKKRKNCEAKVTWPNLRTTSNMLSQTNLPCLNNTNQQKVCDVDWS